MQQFDINTQFNSTTNDIHQNDIKLNIKLNIMMFIRDLL